MQMPRIDMPQRDGEQRSHDFQEVNIGLEVSAATHEAQRCLSCSDPKCVRGCPVGVKIRDFVDLVLEGKYLEAAAKIREDNVLPAVTGRVCPQENQCEGDCVLGRRGSSLAIGHLERFVADYEKEHGQVGLPQNAPPTGKRVAIVGSGPAGLSCAGDLIQRGHQVSVFEALHEVGGVLVYGIPEFRLPKDIVRDEVKNLAAMGVVFHTNVVVGRTVTIDELMQEEGYDAVFLATGAGLPRFLDVEGESLAGVYSANEFLTRVNLMKAYEADADSPIYDCRDRVVAVFGGGNTAMDAVRSAKRLGARQAYLIYRRSEEQMPARLEEVHHAKEEGIVFKMLHNPLHFSGDDEGRLTAVTLQQMELGEPDDSGRRRPQPIKGSEFQMPLDVAIIAIGTSANPLIQSTTPDLATNKWGYIEADEQSMRTSKKGVFAGGDIVSGAATVILAMGAGRKAAASIHAYLTTGKWNGSTPD